MGESSRYTLGRGGDRCLTPLVRTRGTAWGPQTPRRTTKAETGLGSHVRAVRLCLHPTPVWVGFFS